MQGYEVINPSDAVTFRAASLPAAFLAVMLVGGGKYAGEPLDEKGRRITGEAADELAVPIFLFGGAQAWAHKHWPELVPPGSTDDWGSALIAAHRADLLEALRSFCTGSWADRALFESALAKIDDPAKRAAFVAEWDDKRRSSLNAITNRANAIADRLEKEAETCTSSSTDA
jgi:hypothetical protein